MTGAYDPDGVCGCVSSSGDGAGVGSGIVSVGEGSGVGSSVGVGGSVSITLPGVQAVSSKSNVIRVAVILFFIYILLFIVLSEWALEA